MDIAPEVSRLPFDYPRKAVIFPLRTLWTASHIPGPQSGHNPPGDLTFASLALALFHPPGTPQGQG